MLKIEVTNRFKKDLDEAIKRGCKYSNLQIVLEYLSSETRLPDKYKDHKLKDSKYYKNVRECHIQPDWLLIYQIKKDKLILGLIRNGTHTTLFK